MFFSWSWVAKWCLRKYLDYGQNTTDVHHTVCTACVSKGSYQTHWKSTAESCTEEEHKMFMSNFTSSSSRHKDQIFSTAHYVHFDRPSWNTGNKYELNYNKLPGWHVRPSRAYWVPHQFHLWLFISINTSWTLSKIWLVGLWKEPRIQYRNFLAKVRQILPKVASNTH